MEVRMIPHPQNVDRIARMECDRLIAQTERARHEERALRACDSSSPGPRARARSLLASLGRPIGSGLVTACMEPGPHSRFDARAVRRIASRLFGGATSPGAGGGVLAAGGRIAGSTARRDPRQRSPRPPRGG
jgi:hypothetical protein